MPFEGFLTVHDSFVQETWQNGSYAIGGQIFTHYSWRKQIEILELENTIGKIKNSMYGFNLGLDRDKEN